MSSSIRPQGLRGALRLDVVNVVPKRRILVQLAHIELAGLVMLILGVFIESVLVRFTILNSMLYQYYTEINAVCFDFLLFCFGSCDSVTSILLFKVIIYQPNL